MHLVTLSFDDGFEKSNLKIAGIFEKHRLSACFNVIATGHRESFTPPDMWHVGFKRGDFRFWNELQARGHEIMPHGFRHANKNALSLDEAQKSILDCLAIFQEELDGFDPRQAVFNFPYNASNPALERWLTSIVRAYRTAGNGLNPLPNKDLRRLTATACGPKNCEEHLDRQLELLLARPSGWLIYNTHGLDDEGWGPIGSDYLDKLLDRLTAIETVKILPTAKALATLA